MNKRDNILDSLTKERFYTDEDKTENKAFTCYSLESATSSLDIAYKLYEEGSLKEWDSVLVGSQSSGRGQVGRSWNSPKGNLYAAIRLPLDGIFSSQASAPLVGGILVSALRNIFSEKNLLSPHGGDAKFYIKWTNDILIKHYNDYFKCGGILLEEKNKCFLCGIGINLLSAPDFAQNSAELALKASYISNFFNIEKLIINSLWQRLVHSIYLCYISKALEKAKQEQVANISNTSTDFFLQKNLLQQSNSVLAFKNERISLVEALALEDFDYDEENNQITTYTGILREISLNQDSLGALIVDTDLGTRTFISGRVRPL